MLGGMTRVGRLRWAATWAMEKVLPEPVTPMRTWCFLPARKAWTSWSMAAGWSPVGRPVLPVGVGGVGF